MSCVAPRFLALNAPYPGTSEVFGLDSCLGEHIAWFAAKVYFFLFVYVADVTLLRYDPDSVGGSSCADPLANTSLGITLFFVAREAKSGSHQLSALI